MSLQIIGILEHDIDNLNNLPPYILGMFTETSLWNLEDYGVTYGSEGETRLDGSVECAINELFERMTELEKFNYFIHGHLAFNEDYKSGAIVVDPNCIKVIGMNSYGDEFAFTKTPEDWRNENRIDESYSRMLKYEL